MSYSLEKTIRVYEDDRGVFIEVRPHPDFPGEALELHTISNAACIEWYGDVRITLNDREHALALAKAITEMAEMIP